MQDDVKLLKAYRGFGGLHWKNGVYYFVSIDSFFKSLLNWGPGASPITVLMTIFASLTLAYTVFSWNNFLRNTLKFSQLCLDAERNMPRRESIMEIKPGHTCISKHIQQADIFLDKTKKVIDKEKLEVDIINSRLNSITELLNPKDSVPTRSIKSPKVFQEANVITSSSAIPLKPKSFGDDLKLPSFL